MNALALRTPFPAYPVEAAMPDDLPQAANANPLHAWFDGATPAPAAEREIETETYWYAIRTATRMEHKAVKALHEAGFTAYLPCETRHRRTRSEKIKASIALFTGYLFVVCDPEEFPEVRALDGVCQFVRGIDPSGEAVPMLFPATELRWIFIAELFGEFDYTIEPEAYQPARGDRVRIARGKWGAGGYIGTILSMATSQRKAIVSIDGGPKLTLDAELLDSLA